MNFTKEKTQKTAEQNNMYKISREMHNKIFLEFFSLKKLEQAVFNQELFLDKLISLDNQEEQELITIFFSDNFFIKLDKLNVSNIILPTKYKNIEIIGNTRNINKKFTIKNSTEYYETFIYKIRKNSNFSEVIDINNIFSRDKTIIISNFKLENQNKKIDFKLPYFVILNQLELYGLDNLSGNILFTKKLNKFRFFKLNNKIKISNYIKQIKLDNINNVENIFDKRQLKYITIKNLTINNVLNINNEFLKNISNKNILELNLENIDVKKIDVENKNNIFIENSNIEELTIYNTRNVIISERNNIKNNLIKNVENLQIFNENKIETLHLSNINNINIETSNIYIKKIDLNNINEIKLEVHKDFSLFNNVNKFKNIKKVSIFFNLKTLKDIKDLINIFIKYYNILPSCNEYEIDILKNNEVINDKEIHKFINNISKIINPDKKFDLINNKIKIILKDKKTILKELENLYLNFLKLQYNIEIPETLSSTKLKKVGKKTNYKINNI